MNNKFNKGIGAGGTNTTKNGKKFEEKTDNEFVLSVRSKLIGCVLPFQPFGEMSLVIIT